MLFTSKVTKDEGSFDFRGHSDGKLPSAAAVEKCTFFSKVRIKDFSYFF